MAKEERRFAASRVAAQRFKQQDKPVLDRVRSFPVSPPVVTEDKRRFSANRVRAQKTSATHSNDPADAVSAVSAVTSCKKSRVSAPIGHRSDKIHDASINSSVKSGVKRFSPESVTTGARRVASARSVGKSLERNARRSVASGAKAGAKTILRESEKTVKVASGVDGSDDMAAVSTAIKSGASRSSRFISSASAPVKAGAKQASRFAKKEVTKKGRAVISNAVLKAGAKSAAAKAAASQAAAAEVGKRVTLQVFLNSVMTGSLQALSVSGAGIKAVLANPYVLLVAVVVSAVVILVVVITVLIVFFSMYAALVAHPLPDSQMSPFVRGIAQSAILSGKESDVLPSVIIAQAMLESDSGRSELAANACNLFGVKGKYNGQSYWMDTQEYDENGKQYTVPAEFCKYPSWLESIVDHGNFLQTSRYSKVRNNADYVSATQELYKAGYATDPDYAKKLQEIIRAYSLTQYDAGWGARNGTDLYAYLLTLPDSRGRTVLFTASNMLGWPYSQEKASLKTGYTDCSFLSQTAYASIGVDIPRVASDQAKWCVDNGYEITYGDLQPGDLIFYALSTTNEYRSITHVAIYCGSGMVIEASSSQNAVVYRPVWGHDQIVCVAHPF